MSVKISLDHVLIGLNSSSWPDLVEALTDYSSRWYLGPDEGRTPIRQGRSVSTDRNPQPTASSPEQRQDVVTGIFTTGAFDVVRLFPNFFECCFFSFLYY